MSRHRPFALHHEEDASGVVAAVYADVRRRMSFVPAIFKALGADPPVLESAWLQARALFDDRRFPATVARVRARAVSPGVAPARRAVRVAVEPFASDLPAMLVVVSSLGLSLDGRLPPRPPVGSVPAGEAPPEPIVPELRGEHPLYDEIRDAYGTAHVPTLYRSLAFQGLLEEAWSVAGPLLDAADGRGLVAVVARAGEDEALAYPDAACFAAASARPVLDQFRIALPRNLVVALALRGASPP